jgi:hypothetical protein
MRKSIIAIPVDGRPVVREQVQMLVAASGWELVVPDVTKLGYFREPADRDALTHWLQAQAACASGLVLSIDMLVYGGLVASRFMDDPLNTLKKYLMVIETIKTQFPTLPIYAFAATMRISNNNVNEEEKSYWDQYGDILVIGLQWKGLPVMAEKRKMPRHKYPNGFVRITLRRAHEIFR